MHDDELLDLLRTVSDAIGDALGGLDDWGLAETVPGQHTSDLIADAAALDVLAGYDVGVLSEESGARFVDRDLVVVIDPLDGSTNAARGIPWYATSACVVDADGPRVARVENRATGVVYEAVRGGGARRDGAPIRPAPPRPLGEAIVGLSGFPGRWLGWQQYRALGAAALDLCLVADGTLDGYLDCSVDAHGVWDYLAAQLVCAEAGAVVAEAAGRPLATLRHDDRRTPVAASSPGLLEELLEARRSIPH